MINFISSGNSTLDAQLRFSAEIDKMTAIYRRTLLIDGSRNENDAEHSWHIAVMALLFEEYAIEKVDILHAVEMLIVHDLVEIYAGDTFAYDLTGNQSKSARENMAADKLFSILPQEQGEHIRKLWEEFDAATTPDAKYANCMDRLQPFFHNILTQGHTWRNSEYQTSSKLVRQRMSILADFMPEVYLWIEKNLEYAIANKWLKK